MKAKRGSLSNLARYERVIFARYKRAHPHFRRNVFFDAIISCLLVVVLFGEINHVSEYARVNNLLRSGGVSMSADQLASHVKKENISAYWLGAIPGYKYTIICTNRHEIIVSYIPQGISLNHPDQFNLTVETYSNALGSESQAKASLSSDRDDFITSRGVAATIFSNRPQLVRYPIAGTGKYVEVQYPSNTSIFDVYKNIDRLKLISKS